MAYRASATSVTGSFPTTSSVTKPTGTVSGDWVVLVAAAANFNFTTWSWPSGFTQLNAIGNAGNNFASYFSVGIAIKLAGGSEPATYDVGTGGSLGAVTLLAASYSGRAGTQPQAQQADASSGSGGGVSVVVTCTGVTAAAGDDVLWINTANKTSATTPIWTDPALYSSAATADDGTTSISLHMGYRDNVGAGATGSLIGAVTNPSSGTDVTGYVISLSIAVAAGTFIPIIGRGPGMAIASRGGGLVG